MATAVALIPRDPSDKLAHSGDVLRPSSQVDPVIKAPTRPGGRTPLTRPAGAPGGDPNVQPK